MKERKVCLSKKFKQNPECLGRDCQDCYDIHLAAWYKRRRNEKGYTTNGPCDTTPATIQKGVESR